MWVPMAMIAGILVGWAAYYGHNVPVELRSMFALLATAVVFLSLDAWYRSV